MADSDQHSSTRHLCKLNELSTQMACISARPDNYKAEQDFRTACSLYQNENHTSDPFISQTYQEFVDNYNKITSLYLIGTLDEKANLFIYSTENESEEAKLIEIPNILDVDGASIVQLPNGQLFCACKEDQSTFIIFIINKNYKVQILPSEKPYQFITVIYFGGNVYCFGEGKDSEAQSYKFDLERNIWFKLTSMPYHGPYCNSAVFNNNIFITEPSSKNLLQYTIDIDSFSIIPYDFESGCRKVLINGEERLYLIEWSEHGFIYESEVGDEYNWNKIAKSAINQDCGQLYWIYNKRGIYISTLNNECLREYYKFDLDQNAFIGIAYYGKYIATRVVGGKLEAIKCYNQTFNLNPQTALCYGKFTINYLGRYLELIEYYNELIKRNPLNANAYMNKGNALYHLERYLEAIECFDETIKIDARHPTAYYNKGSSLSKMNRIIEAIECYNELIKINPNDIDPYLHKGYDLCTLERYLEAIECYDEIIKINPNNSNAYQYKGNVLYNLDRFLEAIECYDKAIKLDPGNAFLYKEKGDTLAFLGRNLEAIECYDEAIKTDPSYAPAYHKKGNIFLCHLDRKLDAIECYNEASKLDPDNPLNFFNRALAFNNLGQEAEALQDFFRGFYLIKESQKLDARNNAKFNLSQINSNFSDETLKNNFIELLQKLAQLGESAIGFKEEFNGLKNTKNSKLIKEIEEQEERINGERSQFLMKAAGFFSPNDDSPEKMQEKIYQVGREADEYLKRVIATISDLRSSLQQNESADE